MKCPKCNKKTSIKEWWKSCRKRQEKVTEWQTKFVANNIGKGTLSVPTGIQIRIPADSESIIEQYNELNS